MNKQQTQTFTSESKVRVSIVLETINIAPDLFVYRETCTRTVEEIVGFTPAGLNNGYAAEGFITKKELAAKRAGKSWSQRNDLRVLPPEVIARFQTDGFHAAIFPEDDIGLRKDAEIRSDPFTAFSNGEATIDNVRSLDLSNYGVFDHTGKPMPLAMSFSYMNGGVHNCRYDLTKAAEHLLTRSDVVVVKPSGYSSRKGGIASDVREAIQPIPYYNARDGRNRQIEFKWMPSEADYARLVEKVTLKRMAHSDDKYRAIFDLDLLGLRAAGAALYDEYDKSREYEMNEEDED